MSEYDDYDIDDDVDERLYCTGCGLDWPGCGCPHDMNTSTVCLHRGCGSANSTVVREPLYAPAVDS